MKLEDILKAKYKGMTISVDVGAKKYPYLRTFIDAETKIIDIIDDGVSTTICIGGDCNDDWEEVKTEET